MIRSSGMQNSNGDGTAYLNGQDRHDRNIDLEDLVYVQANKMKLKNTL